MLTQSGSLRQRRGGPVLTAVSRSGSVVRLRAPRFSDFEQWRRIRIRDRVVIEPFWVSSPLCWEERHTEKQWVRECLHLRRAHRTLGFAIQIDGQFAGQCTLTEIDFRAGSAEMGMWIDSSLGRLGFGVLAGSMVTDYAFGVLGLHRVTAPISIDNEPAARVAQRGGLVHEATMRSYFDAGGRRKDHNLWAVTADLTPADGFAAQWSTPGGEVPRDSRPPGGRVPSREAIAATARFVLGSVKGHARFGTADTGVVAVCGQSGRGRAVVLNPVPPRQLLRSRNGLWSTGGRFLAMPWSGIPTPPEDIRSGDTLAFGVDAAGTRIGFVGFESFDVVRGNATLRIESESPEPHGDLVPATVALLRHAFRVLGLHRIHTGVDPDDPAAAALVVAAGLEREGRMVGIGSGDGTFRALDLWSVVAPAPLSPAVTPGETLHRHDGRCTR